MIHIRNSYDDPWYWGLNINPFIEKHNYCLCWQTRKAKYSWKLRYSEKQQKWMRHFLSINKSAWLTLRNQDGHEWMGEWEDLVWR